MFYDSDDEKYYDKGKEELDLEQNKKEELEISDKNTETDEKNRKRGPKKKNKGKYGMSIKSLQLDESDIDQNSDNVYFDIIDNTVVTDKPIKNKSFNNKSFNKPWIEKYRPTEIDELVLDEGTLNKIKKFIEDKNMPNIIITGSPGIGKTTTILCIAKNLLGKKYYKNGVLELNASDNRGIKTVQESMEYFCKKKFLEKESNKELNTESKESDTELNQEVKHKIILLDEADNMTKKAQQAINTLMQEYHHNTRFAFTCNNSGQIIEAIQSRCIIFRYSRLSVDHIRKRLEYICKKEEIQYTEEGLNTIIMMSQGDLRQAINNLQLTFNGYNNVIPENVYKLNDKPHPLIIQNIFEACYKKDFKDALINLNSLSEKGYSSLDIVFTMVYTLKNIDKNIIDEKTKILFLEEIGKTSLIISQGMNTPLQLTGSIAALCRRK